MSGWRPEHADQVCAAYDVLRGSAGVVAPAEYLYRHWYAVRAPHAVPRRRWDAPVSGTARAAHGAAAHWAVEDSEVVAMGIAGVVVVATPRGRRALCRGEYVTTQGRPGFPPVVGDRVRALARNGAMTQEGWWRTWGSDWDPQAPSAPLVRVYLRPAPGAVAQLVHAVTSALSDTGEWLLKVAVTPEELLRPDACVAYLAGAQGDRLRDVVTGACAGLTAGGPPPLTERLGDGVGWAQDPGTGESFGEVRCAAIAAAYERLGDAAGGEARLADEVWLEVVAREFGRRGIQTGAPHRTPVLVGANP
ncbi:MULTISPECIES: T3SS effector HopA1 family protein [unclassified Knoellia]|uniref:T3SS effector HopA1 family protein n=1 Tax=Knoellia altitudinis TaxID=3404795 RepID=UPI00360C233E